MSEVATGGVLWKEVFFKISHNSQETPVPKETPVNFAKFLRTLFLQNISGRLLPKCRNFKNETRAINYLCYKKVDVMLIASAKIPEYKRHISPSSFYGNLPDY